MKMPYTRRTRLILFAAALAGFAATKRAQAEGDYSQDIAPIFQRHCQRCHGAENQESDLRLDSGRAALRGGSSGEVITPGSAGSSRLLAILRGTDEDIERMPPEGPGLDETELQQIVAWIDAGAAVPDTETPTDPRGEHWSLQPPSRPPLPQLSDASWARSPIDLFVLARLRAAGFQPSPPTEKATLLRRVSLDLIGVPPTPTQLAEFEHDSAPGAYERAVDRLLASPAYGERWARHWLDLARYADSNGFTRDFAREIWKYREWVIGALNAGMPFDQFTIEQFAGDMLPDPTLDQLIATGFHRNTLINEEGGTDPEQFRVDAIADRVATTGVVYLGLTLGCARCHEHKFDPISQRDYYRVFALLNNCDEPNIDVPYDWQVRQGVVARRDAIRAEIKAKEQALAAQKEAFHRRQLEWESTITPEYRATLPGPTQAALDKAPDERDAAQKKLVEQLFKTTDVAREAFPLVDEIAELRASQPTIPTTMILREREEPRDTYVHRRGNFLDPGAAVEPAAPAVLPPIETADGNADRLDFARWLVDANNPLTARVIVNRYWQRFFGVGIVETENDFGLQGSPPSHPELLDWLAVEFSENGWNIKALHRLIVTSATYRQSSRQRPDLLAVDPANRLLGRQARLRLEAETVRDSSLAASGLLTSKLGGPSVYPPQPEGVFAFTQDRKPWPTEKGEDRYRRGMYTFVWRSSPYPALAVFDAPPGNVTCTRRVRSNTPLQSLTLANGTQFIESARALAREIMQQPPADRLVFAFQRCLVREPNADELERLDRYWQRQREAYAGNPDEARALAGDDQEALAGGFEELAAWTAAARVLMNLDEFITRE